VRLTGARALGDDYGLVLPAGGAWSAAAVPFDNAEAIGPAPPLGLHALAGIWRLHQAPATRVEHPRGSLAVASLLGCLTVPWVLPEQAGPLLENVMRFVSSGAYAHLYFSLGAELWAHLDPLSRP
ncbi:MAG TPA: hypothetical protein VJS92_04540, partial [Candidatus Polarisedimenticolaceae bacterium]|nr:hypothetical protein [Candidatus Polarisedimenticolaceae bacterium]